MGGDADEDDARRGGSGGGTARELDVELLVEAGRPSPNDNGLAAVPSLSGPSESVVSPNSNGCAARRSWLLPFEMMLLRSSTDGEAERDVDVETDGDLEDGRGEGVTGRSITLLRICSSL